MCVGKSDIVQLQLSLATAFEFIGNVHYSSGNRMGSREEGVLKNILMHGEL